MIFHGLMKYGFKDEARELAMRDFRMALNENSATREYYNAETGAGIGQTQFWGFSALYYVMPLEMELNYDPTDLTAPIRPILKEQMNLKFPDLPATP
jgi:hypothetical protein